MKQIIVIKENEIISEHIKAYYGRYVVALINQLGVEKTCELLEQLKKTAN